MNNSMDKNLELLFKQLYKRSDQPSKNTLDAWLHAHEPKLTSFHSHEKSGKWCLFVKPEEIDSAWEKIKQAAKESKIMLAKTSTAMSSANYDNYVICVYTNNWEDMDDLKKSREVLRELGFTDPISYKRDVETMNHVYGTKDEFYVTM